MGQETKIIQNVTVELKGDSTGANRSTLTIRLALSGTVTVSEQSFAWNGLRKAADAEMVATLARWALGRELAAVAKEHPRSITANQNGDAWDVTLSWRVEGYPGIVVNLSQFTSLDAAQTEAQAAIEYAISLLVPPEDVDQRRAFISHLNIASPGAWSERLSRGGLLYP